jgi:hypothetical protein
MKPKPLVELNHFTVPVAMVCVLGVGAMLRSGSRDHFESGVHVRLASTGPRHSGQVRI